jgi:hypothetical protein
MDPFAPDRSSESARDWLAIKPKLPIWLSLVVRCPSSECHAIVIGLLVPTYFGKAMVGLDA